MRKKHNYKRNMKELVATLIIFAIIFIGSYVVDKSDINLNNIETNTLSKVTYSSLNDIPEYTGEICVEINNNKPSFNEADYTTKAFENYSELDYLGRCGVAYANVCKEIMPPERR